MIQQPPPNELVREKKKAAMIQQWTPTAQPKREAAPQPTPAQIERRRKYAATLCANARNKTSWVLADKLAKSFDCGGCAELGFKELPE